MLLATACLIASLGCGSDRRSPVAPVPQTDFYPLAVGNQWRYDLSRRIQIILNGDSMAPRVQDLTEERELVAVDTVGGREYVVEERRLIDPVRNITIRDTVLLRQDDTGLYAIRMGQLPENESVILRYPLEPGAEWLRRPLGPPVTLTVEDRDTLDLASGMREAFRIRLEFAALGPEDFSRVWYGPCGFLRSTGHQETMAKNALTCEIALIISDDSTELVALDLTDPGRCATP